MHQRIAHIALIVKDYDEAISFYTRKLDFELLEDTKIDDAKRWVLIAPPGARECCLLLAKAADKKQTDSIGKQTGGRVFLFLFTDDFWRDYNKMVERKIKFVRPPKEEPYGKVAVFEDLYGNLYDLLEPNENTFGKMDVNQMVCHCTDFFRMAKGTKKAEEYGTIGSAEIKALAPAGETIPAPKGFGQVEGQATKPTDLENDKKILKDHIRWFSQLPEDFDLAPHPYFDKMDSEKWIALAIYHLDHHLKQFGV